MIDRGIPIAALMRCKFILARKIRDKINTIRRQERKSVYQLPGVKYWLRNVARHPESFRLPLVADWFYPDFVALLEDGRLFVIEYKGALRDPLDTAEKRTIGELWQRKSSGKGLFSVVEKSVNSKDMRRQLMEIIGAA